MWAVASAAPQRFAAIVPICGSGDADEIARSLAPHASRVWVWHGSNDAVVPVEASDVVVRALRAAGGGGVRYERLAAAPAPVGWADYVGHASWIPAFAAESPLWAWLREQRRPAA